MINHKSTIILLLQFNRYGSGGSSVSGALLLCVVGGKLSEGINFSNDLGRWKLNGCWLLIQYHY